MFNVSERTFWFIIIFISIICICMMFYNSRSCCQINRYSNLKYKTTYSYDDHFSQKSDNQNITSETIRKKQNRKHTESKQIYKSPKNNIISIKDQTKQLELKLKNNKTIKSQYVKLSDDKTLNKIKRPIVKQPIVKQPIVKQQLKPTIRLFFAEWCGHCNDFKPIWFELKKQYENKINFEEIDCSHNNPELEYVEGFPTISIYDKNNKYLENYENDRSKNAFKQFLDYLSQ
jgi:thiol-disulfide isomerase/thioredoxin